MSFVADSGGSSLPRFRTTAGDPVRWQAVEPLHRGGRRQADRQSDSREWGRVQVWALMLLSLSTLDFLITAWLLNTSSRFYEANPVAQWFFAQWNLAGLLGFKFVIILGVIAMSEFIEMRRAGWGRLVLAFGSIAATYAIVQGASLLVHPAMTGEDEVEEVSIEAFQPSPIPPGELPVFTEPGPSHSPIPPV